MTNRQRQLLVVFLASMGFGLLLGLAYSLTSQMIRPGKIDLYPSSSDPNGQPAVKGPPLPEQNRGPSESDVMVSDGNLVAPSTLYETGQTYGSSLTHIKTDVSCTT